MCTRAAWARVCTTRPRPSFRPHSGSNGGTSDSLPTRPDPPARRSRVARPPLDRDLPTAARRPQSPHRPRKPRIPIRTHPHLLPPPERHLSAAPSRRLRTTPPTPDLGPRAAPTRPPSRMTTRPPDPTADLPLDPLPLRELLTRVLASASRPPSRHPRMAETPANAPSQSYWQRIFPIRRVRINGWATMAE